MAYFFLKFPLVFLQTCPLQVWNNLQVVSKKFLINKRYTMIRLHNFDRRTKGTSQRIHKRMQRWCWIFFVRLNLSKFVLILKIGKPLCQNFFQKLWHERRISTPVSMSRCKMTIVAGQYETKDKKVFWGEINFHLLESNALFLNSKNKILYCNAVSYNERTVAYLLQSKKIINFSFSIYFLIKNQFLPSKIDKERNV